jgi:hypothetical protein
VLRAGCNVEEETQVCTERLEEMKSAKLESDEERSGSQTWTLFWVCHGQGDGDYGIDWPVNEWVRRMLCSGLLVIDSDTPSRYIELAYLGARSVDDGEAFEHIDGIDGASATRMLEGLH